MHKRISQAIYEDFDLSAYREARYWYFRTALQGDLTWTWGETELLQNEQACVSGQDGFLREGNGGTWRYGAFCRAACGNGARKLPDKNPR